MRVGKVVLVAPWIDPDGELGPENDFFAFELDPKLAERTSGFVVFNSDNDDQDVQQSAWTLRDTVENAAYREFQARRHFCFKDIGAEFPELLAEVLG